MPRLSPAANRFPSLDCLRVGVHDHGASVISIALTGGGPITGARNRFGTLTLE